MKILSIDFDYFVTADLLTRAVYFPDCGWEMSDETNRVVWSGSYAAALVNGKDMTSITVLQPELQKLSEHISRQDDPICMVADSHKYAYDFIVNQLGYDDCMEVYNVDYHHDSRQDNAEVNCGNWLGRLMADGDIDKIYWAHRDTSSKEQYIHDVIDFDEVLRHNYDAIFVCRSSWWTPPHLDDEFIRYLAKPIIESAKKWQCRYQKGIMESRYNQAFHDEVCVSTQALSEHKKKHPDSNIQFA